MAEEKKSVPKQGKKLTAPKKEVLKPDIEKTQKTNKSKIVLGSKVKTPFNSVSEVYAIEGEYCLVRKQENRKKLYKFHKSELILEK